MATLGWLKIGVTTDTGQLAKGLKSAAHTVESFKSTVLGVGASLGVAFGVKEIVDWVRGAGEAVTETRTLGERVGLTAEAMGKLQYAARLSHVDGETLTNSLEKMNEKLGDVAITGEGPAADALRRFGLSARQLTAMGTEKAFFTLVDVIGSIANPAERAAVAMDLFGKSGQPIINMAAKGSEALRAMGEEAMATGAALSSVDAEKVVEADTAMVRIGETIGGVANQIAVELAPFVTAAADQFVMWMKSGTKAGSFMAQSIDWVTTAVGGVIDVVQVLSGMWHFMQAAFDTALSDILEGIDGLIKAFGWLYEKVTGIKLELTETAKVMADGLGEAAAEELKKAMAPGKWGHQIAREFVDNLRTGAEQRATFNAQKAQSFAGAGTAVEHPKVVEPQFAGALQLGSKEAYSAVLKSRAMLQNSVQSRIEVNTRTTAEASQRMAAGINRMAQVLEGRNGDGQLGREMAGAH